jgi:hypothetical protein
MSEGETALYWGVDAAGIPYPLDSFEAMCVFHLEYPERTAICYDTWHTEQEEEVIVSTKFFGTDISTSDYPQGRCMFETVILLDGHEWYGHRLETRTLAEECHQAALLVAGERWPAKQAERKEER